MARGTSQKPRRRVGFAVVVALAAVTGLIIVVGFRARSDAVTVREARCTSFGDNRHPVWFIRDGWAWFGSAKAYSGDEFSAASTFTSSEEATVIGPDGEEVAFHRGHPADDSFTGVACAL